MVRHWMQANSVASVQQDRVDCREQGLETFVWIVHVLATVGVIILVMLQHGKGADMGATFGSGSSGSLFGASGSANFLSRMTAAFAAVFFMTSLGLTYLSGHKAESGGVMEKEMQSESQSQSQPAVTGPAPVAPEVPEGEASKATAIPK